MTWTYYVIVELNEAHNGAKTMLTIKHLIALAIAIALPVALVAFGGIAGLGIVVATVVVIASN